MRLDAILVALVLGSLLAVHVVATRGRLVLPDNVLRAVAITPRTTFSQWPRHFIAGFFHRGPSHLAFNGVLFTVGFLGAAPLGPWQVLASAYAISFFGVMAVHALVILPLARLGSAYAVSALDVPLVGASAIAYATVGMGLHVLAQTHPAAALVLGAGAVAFELIVGILRLTSPFVSVYHLTGLAAGFLAAWTLPIFDGSVA